MATEKVTNKLHNTSLHAAAELMHSLCEFRFAIYTLTPQTFDPINGCPIFPKQRAISHFKFGTP